MEKIDCFAYIDRNGHKSCYCLSNLYCAKGKCNFYNNKITVKQIEKEITGYLNAKER